jgi:hypothetical protein
MSFVVWPKKRANRLLSAIGSFSWFFVAGHWQAAGEQLAGGFSLTN